jgi:hypothetical protein
MCVCVCGGGGGLTGRPAVGPCSWHAAGPCRSPGAAHPQSGACVRGYVRANRTTASRRPRRSKPVLWAACRARVASACAANSTYAKLCARPEGRGGGGGSDGPPDGWWRGPWTPHPLVRPVPPSMPTRTASTRPYGAKRASSSASSISYGTFFTKSVVLTPLPLGCFNTSPTRSLTHARPARPTGPRRRTRRGGAAGGEGDVEVAPQQNNAATPARCLCLARRAKVDQRIPARLARVVVPWHAHVPGQCPQCQCADSIREVAEGCVSMRLSLSLSLCVCHAQDLAVARKELSEIVLGGGVRYTRHEHRVRGR